MGVTNHLLTGMILQVENERLEPDFFTFATENHLNQTFIVVSRGVEVDDDSFSKTTSFFHRSENITKKYLADEASKSSNVPKMSQIVFVPYFWRSITRFFWVCFYNRSTLNSQLGVLPR